MRRHPPHRVEDELGRSPLACTALEVFQQQTPPAATAGLWPQIQIAPYNDNPNATRWYGKRLD
jgi:hypothetical protein